MKLENVSAEIRPRSSWEAIDLGMALTRRDYGGIMAAWWCTVAPFCALLVALLHTSPQLWILAIFWFNPLYDRVPLFILSRSLFGTRPTLKALFRSPQFFFSGLLGDLTWRRFSPSRSASMPIRLLERLKGKAQRQRAQALNRESDAHHWTVIGMCGLFEGVLTIGICILVLALLPTEDLGPNVEDWLVSIDTGTLNPFPTGLIYLFSAAYFIAMSTMEPFYVGAGFGMYVNGRTCSDGWDLELSLRQLESRLVSTMTKVAILLVIGSLLLPFQLGYAQTSDLSERPPDDVIAEILAQPEFTIHTRTETRYQREPNENNSLGSRDAVTLFQALGEFLFWILLVVAIAALIYWIYSYRHVFQRFGRAPPTHPPHARATTVMGMDVRAESFPDNLTEVAWAAWAAGRRQDALSLLYRGSISWLVEREHLPIIESDTESDCLDRAHSLRNRSMHAYFTNVTHRWTNAAYGKLWPNDEEVKHLCQSWPFHHRGGTS